MRHQDGKYLHANWRHSHVWSDSQAFYRILNYRPTFDNQGISCEKSRSLASQKNLAFPGAKRPPPWRRDALGVVAQRPFG